MSSETDLQQVLPAWLELASKTDVSLGLDPSEAFQRAGGLLNDLRSGQSPPESWMPDADQVEVLHALVALVCREENDPKTALRDIELVSDFISALPWPAEQFGGPRDLLAACAFQAWRTARRFAGHPEAQKWASRAGNASDAKASAERALAVPLAERESRAEVLRLNDPELLLCVCEILRSQLEIAPASVRDDAESFYSFVDQSAHPIGIHDEREYFLGELALTAGTASRFLFKIEDAKAWLHRAEAGFSLVQNANSHSARVAYQRLAISLEERKIDEVLELAPRWSDAFRRLDMVEDALKCRFLEGIAFWERGDAQPAIEVYVAIAAEADSLHNTRLVALATNNLVVYLADSGETDRALEYARKALPLLKQLNSLVHLAKLQWSMGDLFRKQGQRAAAIGAYREALANAAELGIRGDVAALHLVVADLLLEAGQEAQAEWEIRAALPIIDEEKMVPEGIAALSLLRESLRRRQIDKQALRHLHGYFQEK